MNDDPSYAAAVGVWYEKESRAVGWEEALDLGLITKERYDMMHTPPKGFYGIPIPYDKKERAV
ncbi:MAG: hypothetical protein LBS92_01755 [Candidatus Methanoplasma sp.]|jgi:hypothetical protein|nr:hypothetical protein [Candidatus Methanoplasma sp.]